MIVPVKTIEKEKTIMKKEEKSFMVSFCLNLLVTYLIHITYSSEKNPCGKTSWMISDYVSNLAIKRMMYFV